MKKQKIMKNWKTYHLIERKTGNVKKHWIYGNSPSEIRGRLGGYNQKELALIPTRKYDTTTSIKKHLRNVNISKRNLIRARKKK